MGVKAIHFQVRLTADEIPIVYGHSLLEVKTNGTGKVRDVTYNFLAMLNASVMDDNQKCFPDEKIPRLEEMMELCLTNRILMVIELRGRPAELVAAVKILFKRNALLHKHVIAISDHPYLIYVLRRNIPTLLCGLIYRKNRMSEKLNGNAHSNFIYFGYFLMDWLFEWSCKYWLWYVCGNTFIFAYRSHVSEAMVEHYLKFGIVTVVWPVNVEVEKDYFMKALRCPVMTETLSHEIIHTRSVSLDSLKAAEIQKLLVAENLRHRESINKKLQIHVSKKDS